MFGSELWSIDVSEIEVFCVAWRKGLRRVISLLPATHCYLLPLLLCTLPMTKFANVLRVLFCPVCFHSAFYCQLWYHHQSELVGDVAVPVSVRQAVLF